jgi:nuclear transport factor 2 (NTF2) superfamily protein
LVQKSPYITYLTLEPTEDRFEDESEKEMVKKVTAIIEKLGFTDIAYDYRDDSSYYFEAYSGALEEVRVDIEGNVAKVYDRYITDKHFVYLDEFTLDSSVSDK